MRAYVMPANCRSFEEIRLVERPDPAPGRGQVLVRVRAASLNRRDQAIADGSYFGKPIERETIPLSDCAGDVIAVGDEVTTVKPGDRVAATFFQTPPGGSPFAAEAALASPLDGVLAERIVLYENGIVPIPDALSFEEAACLPCAGVTAWNALMCAGRPVEPGQTVLTLGTGGVSIFALQLALAAGARVIVTSSSEAKLARARALGASATINYAQSPEWHKDVAALTGGRGVNCVVEVVGVGTLERSFDAVAEHGKVCLIGVMTGRRAPINPYGMMWKQASLHGIRVGTREMFLRMNRAIEANGVTPVIDTVVPFDSALEAWRLQASGQFVGKIVITLSA
jgi:NADPH:quinone reductase-like Zn-dependent oxidoreductase